MLRPTMRAMSGAARRKKHVASPCVRMLARVPPGADLSHFRRSQRSRWRSRQERRDGVPSRVPLTVEIARRDTITIGVPSAREDGTRIAGVTVDEAAAALGVHAGEVRQALRMRRLGAWWNEGAPRLDPRDVESSRRRELEAARPDDGVAVHVRVGNRPGSSARLLAHARPRCGRRSCGRRRGLPARGSTLRPRRNPRPRGRPASHARSPAGGGRARASLRRRVRRPRALPRRRGEHGSRGGGAAPGGPPRGSSGERERRLPRFCAPHRLAKRAGVQSRRRRASDRAACAKTCSTSE